MVNGLKVINIVGGCPCCYGHLWSFTVIYGHLRSCMVIYDHFYGHFHGNFHGHFYGHLWNCGPVTPFAAVVAPPSATFGPFHRPKAWR